jgi:hypothetical protein
MDGGFGEFLLLIPEWMDVWVISCCSSFQNGFQTLSPNPEWMFT